MRRHSNIHVCSLRHTHVLTYSCTHLCQASVGSVICAEHATVYSFRSSPPLSSLPLSHFVPYLLLSSSFLSVTLSRSNSPHPSRSHSLRLPLSLSGHLLKNEKNYLVFRLQFSLPSILIYAIFPSQHLSLFLSLSHSHLFFTCFLLFFCSTFTSASSFIVYMPHMTRRSHSNTTEKNGRERGGALG